MIASNELLKAFQAMQKHAMDLAKLNGKQLDYDASSLKNVDAILYKIYDEHVRGRKVTQQLDQELYGTALSLGCYIIEVIERNFGAGTWRRTVDSEGREHFVYTYEGIEIMPIGWCIYSLYHGSRKNVQDQFDVFAKKATTVE